MPDGKVKCYSYIRWSSEQQSSGTTLERQLHTAREIAAEHGLELVELIDKGCRGAEIVQPKLAFGVAGLEIKTPDTKRWCADSCADQKVRNSIDKTLY